VSLVTTLSEDERQSRGTESEGLSARFSPRARRSLGKLWPMTRVNDLPRTCCLTTVSDIYTPTFREYLVRAVKPRDL